MKFFSYGLDNEFQLHATADEAQAAAEKWLDDALNDSEWAEDTAEICWGELRQHVTAVSTRERCAVEDCEERFGGIAPCDGGHHADYDTEIDYQLRDVAAK